LAVATLVTSLGDGAFFATGTVYLVSVVGLSVGDLASGLALAGGCGLAAGIPLGRLADRVGSKPVLVALMVLQGAAVFAYVGVATWGEFVAAATLAVGAERGAAGVRNSFIAAITEGAHRVRARAFLRSVSNSGASLGAAGGAAVLASGSRSAFTVLLVADGLTFLFAAAIVARIRVPRSTCVPNRGTQLAVLRDRRFLAMACSQSFLSLHVAILTIALPV